MRKRALLALSRGPPSPEKAHWVPVLADNPRLVPSSPGKNPHFPFLRGEPRLYPSPGDPQKGPIVKSAWKKRHRFWTFWGFLGLFDPSGQG